MRKIIICAVLFLGIYSCKQKEDGLLVIPLEYGVDKVAPFEESGLDYSYEIIPLEVDTANVSSFIGNSWRFIVYKDYIYFPDYSTAPKIFSTKGKFIKSLVAGKGPGEVGRNVDDIYIDRENDYLEVSQYYDKISKYTLEGEHVGDVKNDRMTADVCKFGDYYLIYDGIASHDLCFFSMINHRTGERVSEMFPKILENGVGDSWGLMANGVFMRNANGIYFNIPYTDTIFKMIEGDTIPNPFAKIDNVLVHDKCPEFEYWALTQLAQTEKKNMYTANLSVSDDETLISFKVNESYTEDDEVLHRVLYDKSQNKMFNYPVKMMDIVFSDGEYDYGMVFPETLDGQRDKFSSSELPLMNELCRLIDKNGVDTNPYIVKIKIFRK